MTAVYIETTIPSFFHTARTDTRSLARQRWTREWWDEIAPRFVLFSRDAVIAELQRGTIEDLKTLRIALISDLNLLEVSHEVTDIATIYMNRLVMPRDGAGDALHLNCKHLANPRKFGHIARVNDELGLTTPLLTTPLNYLSEDDSNGD